MQSSIPESTENLESNKLSLNNDVKRLDRITKKGLQGDLKKRHGKPLEFLIEKTISVVSFFSLASIILIFVFVFREASSVFNPQKHQEAKAPVEQMETYGEAPGDNAQNQTVIKEAEEKQFSIFDLFKSVWQPVSLNPQYGIWPLFLGSLKVALISILFGAPIAVFAALYTTSFAPAWIKELIKPIVEILAGFPSVVIGFFALIVLASIVQHTFGLQYRLNAFVGGTALSLAIIPVIFTISEDALNAVPRSYSEASLALGGEKWQTALLVVLPAAIPGIYAAILLGIGRAIGETMIVLMATGNAALATLNPFEPVRTMSATIGAEMAEVVFGDFHYSVLFFIGVLLFVVSFGLNLIAETVVRRLLMKRYK